MQKPGRLNRLEVAIVLIYINHLNTLRQLFFYVAIDFINGLQMLLNYGRSFGGECPQAGILTVGCLILHKT